MYKIKAKYRNDKLSTMVD